MKLNTLLEYLLRESEEEESDNPKGYGKYLFAPERSDTPEPKEPNSKSTKDNPIPVDEHDLLLGLNNFYGGEITPTTNTAMKVLFDLSQTGIDDYSKLLKPPSGLAYRFVGKMTPEEASKLYLNGYPVEDIISQPNKAFYVNNIGTIKNPAAKSTMTKTKASTKLSSWTTNPNNSFFSFVSSDIGKVSILLVADIQSNNFFMNADNVAQTLTKKVLPTQLIKKEQEVVGYGSINVLGAAVMYIGASKFGYVERGEVIHNCPELNIPEHCWKDTVFDADTFKPAFNYINSIINNWEHELGSDSEHIIKMKTNSPYLRTKHWAENGYVCSNGINDSNHLTSTFSDTLYLITNLYAEATDAQEMDGHGDNIQDALIKALKNL